MLARPELTGDRGAISSTHWLATAAGMSMLERGGNAFDAATAAGFVLQVVEPHSNGLGGDLAAVLYSAAPDTTDVICGQGPMPKTATLEHFTALGLGHLPGSGVLPATVPGALSGWLLLLQRYGTMPLAAVLEPAIGYAAEGYPLVEGATRAIRAVAPLFASHWTESGRTYLAGGLPSTGTRMRNLPLAETLQRLLRYAAAVRGREAQIETAHRAFYQGFVAEAIDSFIRNNSILDSTGRRHRGLLSADDLASWSATVEPPVSARYRRYTAHKPGPWSQGPVFNQQLGLLEGIDLTSAGLGSGDFIHTLTEAAKLSFADREAWYGDPDFTRIPIDTLLSTRYADERRTLIGDRAAERPAPGTPDGHQSWIPQVAADNLADDAPQWMAELREGVPTATLAATARASDTCAIVAADRHGNFVAAVPSGGWLKSSPIIPGLGFALGTRGQTMWLVDGHPNAVRPGARPRSTLSPTVVLRDGRPFLALGTPGGDRQDQWTLQSFLAVADFGLGLQAATEIVTFHSDHFPSSFAPRSCRPGVLVAERNLEAAVIADLRRRGHRVVLAPEHSMGKVCMVGRDPGTGFLRAAAGPRGAQAYAACS